MAGRDHDTLRMICPSCGHSGVAQISTSNSMFARSEGFRVDQSPEGFTVAKAAPNQSQTEMRCKCGRVFKL